MVIALSLNFKLHVDMSDIYNKTKCSGNAEGLFTCLVRYFVYSKIRLKFYAKMTEIRGGFLSFKYV